MEIRFYSVNAAEEERHVTILVCDLGTHYCQQVLLQQILVHGVACMAPKSRADSLVELVCITAHGGDLERNVDADNEKPMQITKEIDGVLLTCGYIADDSSKLVLNSLQLVERFLSCTV